ncbi:Snare protein [Entamoeba marina]
MNLNDDLNTTHKQFFESSVTNNGDVCLSIFVICELDSLNYNMNQSDARFAEINDDLDETQGLMQKNIEDMTRNIATADELEDQTDVMQSHASDFRSNATDLKRSMWWKNMKLWIIIGCVVAVLLIIFVIFIIIISTAGGDDK